MWGRDSGFGKDCRPAFKSAGPASLHMQFEFCLDQLASLQAPYIRTWPQQKPMPWPRTKGLAYRTYRRYMHLIWMNPRLSEEQGRRRGPNASEL